MKKILRGLILAGITVASFNVSAATIATSLIDNNGEWTTGNTSNQWLGPIAGLSPTAGSHMMHFNSSRDHFSEPVSISFDGLSIEAGTYQFIIDIGSFTNFSLAIIDSIGMTVDGIFLSPSSVTGTDPSQGQWQTWVYEYTILSGIEGILGFGIDVASSGVDANIAFDNLIVNYDAVSPVPLPAAVWLFGSGLLGLIGFRSRKETA